MNGSTSARGGEHLAALRGTLTYADKKRDRVVGIQPAPLSFGFAPWSTHSPGRTIDEPTPASLFDVARIVYRVDPAELKHPLCFYIPKSESAEEALWWRDVFQAMAAARAGRGITSSACAGRVPSARLPDGKFLYNLGDHILGLNLGRWITWPA